MIVCIAEKPSVAQEIARVLGADRRCQGYFEGGGYQVTWTYGHLCELKAPEDYDERWKRWSLGALPIVPRPFGIRLKADKGVERQFAVIKKLFLEAGEIVNCGDAGQEGELIQRWVLQLSGARCPVKRLWISSLTEESIREGFASLRPAEDYARLYEAGLCRAVGDWLLGINATRAYTIKYGGQSRGERREPLSVGRVQTPTLALIVERKREIDEFRPEPYWVLTTKYRGVVLSATRGRFTVKAEAETALAKVRGEEFVVTSVTKKQGREAPPRLFDLTSLQVECNRRLGLSAEQTLGVIQSLYEKKLTTYPRVDTTFLPVEMHKKSGAILNGLKDYAALLEPLRGRPLRKRTKVFDDKKITDHHAIIPTGVAMRSDLSGDERAVYDLVARRFIGVFYPDLIFDQTTVVGCAGGVDFRVVGRHIVDEGWRSVVGAEPKAKGEETEPETLPEMVEGERGEHEPALSEKVTTPPKPYTEATLLRAMETAGRLVEDEELRDALKANGIGRPSTRAAIIETLLKRKYIERVRKSLQPTERGIGLIGLIRNRLLKSVELTGQWERKLRGIERGEVKGADFIAEMKAMVGDVVLEVLRGGSGE